MRLKDIFKKIKGDGTGIILELFILRLVNASRMISAYPLAPAVKDKFAIQGDFLSGKVWIADEEEMSGKTCFCQGLR
jgi:hypothetical protein